MKIVCLSVQPSVCLMPILRLYGCAFYQALTLHRFIKRTPYLIAHKFSNGKFAKTHDEEMKRWRVHFQEVLNYCPEPSTSLNEEQLHHMHRLLKMTAGARFESLSEWPQATRGEWPKATRGVGYGEGCPPPHRGGVWGEVVRLPMEVGSGVCPLPRKKWKFVAEINAFW